jgi:hypothetical protein
MFGRPILCANLLERRVSLPSAPVLPSTLLLPGFRLLRRALRWGLRASLLRCLSPLLLLGLLSPLRLSLLRLRLHRLLLGALWLLLRPRRWLLNLRRRRLLGALLWLRLRPLDLLLR